jgi:outer membrane protein assembly factor BamB
MGPGPDLPCIGRTGMIAAAVRGVGTVRIGRVLVAMTVATLAIVLDGPLTAAAGGGRTQWPQYQGDAGHSGWDRGESILDPSNVGDLAPAWSAFSESFYPIVSGGMVFKIGNVPDRMDALDAATGELVWRSGPGLSGNAGVSGSLLYLTQPNRVLALRTKDGTTLWSTPTEQELDFAPVIADGVVYEMSTGLVTLYALDAATGDILWSLRLPNGAGTPAVADHRVFVEAGRRLFALNPADGRVLWRVRGLPFVSALNPVATSSGVFVVRDGAVYAFDPATGARLWRSAKRGYTDLTVNRTHVFAVAGSDGLFTAFDAAHGTERWSMTVAGGPFRRPPVIGGGMLFSVADDGRVVALRTEGGSTIPLSLSVGETGSLALLQGTLYVQADTTLSAFTLPAG